MLTKQILQLHLTTEKSTLMKERANEYIFRVDIGANKLQIENAVREAFGVKVKTVRTMIVAGKHKRSGKQGRNVIKTQKWKKAIIQLDEGQVIADFENI